MTPPFTSDPVLVAGSPDGARVAVFGVPAAAAWPAADPAATPLLLVHGTGSDHTTWRVTGPLLAPSRATYALDRRGRGGSTDGPAYGAAREVEDIAAVATALADRHATAVAILGHSLGGRLAIAAARAPSIRRVIAYEGAPGEAGQEPLRPELLLASLRDALSRGDLDTVLARFLLEGGGLPPDELAAFRASPLWAARAAIAPTIVRELDASLHDPAIGLEVLSLAPVPVLQVTGSGSPSWLRDGAAALQARLPHGSLARLEGARHNAHHTHATALAEAVDGFLAG